MSNLIDQLLLPGECRPHLLPGLEVFRLGQEGVKYKINEEEDTGHSPANNRMTVNICLALSLSLSLNLLSAAAILYTFWVNFADVRLGEKIIKCPNLVPLNITAIVVKLKVCISLYFTILSLLFFFSIPIAK